jgi:hypothetical protein
MGNAQPMAAEPVLTGMQRLHRINEQASSMASHAEKLVEHIDATLSIVS